MPALVSKSFRVIDYNLALTLDCGQAFRWRHRAPDFWESVIGGRWVQLSAKDQTLTARTPGPVPDWGWLSHYLQLELDLSAVLATFPDDLPMLAAQRACRGLRLLRQDPWECLASFILSSTKQIVQIRQIVEALCRCHGVAIPLPACRAPAFAFPSAERVAALSESELRACKMGFRAPYLLETARLVAGGQLNLQALEGLPLEECRALLMQLPGVGRKIADCVLLFAYGRQAAFPVDVWIMKALQELYFPHRRRTSLNRLHAFAASHFGPNAGYAQQYLFHYMRTLKPQNAAIDVKSQTA